MPDRGRQTRRVPGRLVSALVGRGAIVALACVPAFVPAMGAAADAGQPGQPRQPDLAAVNPVPVASPSYGTPTERVTLERALELAMAQNPSVEVARQEIARAEGLLREARAAELPTLFGTGTYTRLDHDRVTSTGIRIGAANQWNATLTLGVPLLVPTTWSSVNRAKDGRTQAVAASEDARRQLAATVARAYLAIVLEHRQVEVAERARETARAHFDFAHTRLVGGVGTSLDDVRAEQALRSDEAQVAAMREALTRAQAALATALSSDHLLDAMDDVTLAPPPDAAVATEEARRNRTDVKVLRAELHGAERRRASLWTLYAPYLIANGQALIQDLGSQLQPTQAWQAQLVLTVPFYDGGIRNGQRRERDADQAEARAQLEGTLRAVSVEVRSSFQSMMHADDALAAARAAAKLARRAAELADLAYRAGATTNLELIDAERAARDAETQVAVAEDGARQARLDLLLATGRFP